MDAEFLLSELRAVLRSVQPEPLTVSIEEAAKRLSVSPSTVRRLIVGHKLLTVRIGGRVMVPMAELRRMVEPAKEPAPPTSLRAKAMASNLRKRR